MNRDDGTATLTYDTVIVGSGVGGLTAAVIAATNDASVVVLEKATVLGGTSGLSGAQLWIPANHHMQAQGIDDSVEQATAYLKDLAGEFYANTEAARWFAEHASEAVLYLSEVANFSVQTISGLPDYHTTAPGAKREGRYLEPEPLSREEIPDWAELANSPHLPGGVTTTEMLEWGGALTPKEWDWDVINQRRDNNIVTMGTSMIGQLLRACESLDIDVHSGVNVTNLLTEGDTVTGVEVEGEGVPSTFKARDGVLLNTGSYDWDESLIENFEGIPASHAVSAAIPTATGDGLRMAALEGAKLAAYPPIGGAKGFFVAVPDSVFLDVPLYRYCYNVGLPHAIAVNSSGERFCDESFYPKQATEFYDPTGEYDDMPYYMIFDETYREKYAIANYKPGTSYPPEFLAASSSSLTTLAEELGFSPETLQETVSVFNQYANDGKDPEYGRGENEWGHVWCGDPTQEPNPNLGPVEEPPFYAVRLYVGLSSMSNTGLVTDKQGRVQNWNNKPIDGLYATGSVCAPVEWGIGYQSGLQNARSLTDGYLAGLHLTKST